MPPYNQAPSPDGYGDCVNDAVTLLGMRLPKVKHLDITFTSDGQAQSLPADFFRLISLTSWFAQWTEEEIPTHRTRILNTPLGLIPVSPNFYETVDVDDIAHTIQLSPVSTFQQVRALTYLARIYIDPTTSDVVGLKPEHLPALIAKARAQALRLQANKALQDAYSLTVGDETINKMAQSGAFRKMAEDADREFDSYIDAYTGAQAW